MRTLPLVAVTCLVPLASAIEREHVTFAIDHVTASGQSMYVLGDIDELGAGNPAYAVRLEPSAYPTWRATIAIRRGLTFTYRFGWRNDAVTAWKDPSNWNLVSGPFTMSTSAAQPYPLQKGVYYHSLWNPPTLHWRLAGSEGDFTATVMTDAGPGRNENERRWRGAHFGQAERGVEFYFTGGEFGRDPASGWYSTVLDTIFVQDANLYDYVPPPVVSPPQQTNFGTFFSTILGENRPYRVLRPRGYTQNTWKRYPVLYMHDGQNVFDVGPFGSWDADTTANLYTRRGWMREVLIVAVDNTANRARDYIPPDDIVPIGPGSGAPGRANLYAAFLISELKPAIDAAYRTYPDRLHTATIGSSLGGVVALYLGWDHNATFAKCGPMSGSWWLGNFPTRVLSEPYRDLRSYLDSGDSGTSNDGAWGTMNLRDGLMAKGYVLEGDLRHVVGYNHQHNEAAWAQRLPKALDFLFPISEAENTLEEVFYRGDCNCDAHVDFDDIDYFVAALSGEAAWRALYQAQHDDAEPPCRYLNADADGSGGVDFDDIDAFVALIGAL